MDHDKTRTPQGMLRLGRCVGGPHDGREVVSSDGGTRIEVCTTDPPVDAPDFIYQLMANTTRYEWDGHNWIWDSRTSLQIERESFLKMGSLEDWGEIERELRGQPKDWAKVMQQREAEREFMRKLAEHPPNQ